jgi:hypothetical protein
VDENGNHVSGSDEEFWGYCPEGIFGNDIYILQLAHFYKTF